MSEYGLLGMDYSEQFDCVLDCFWGSLEVVSQKVWSLKSKEVPCCQVELVEVILEPRSCLKV